MTGEVGAEAVIRRITAVDVLEHDAGALVLLDTRLVSLGPIGAAVYELCGEDIGEGELVEALELRFGPAPGGTSLDATAAAVANLVSEGVLTRRVPEPAETATTSVDGLGKHSDPDEGLC